MSADDKAILDAFRRDAAEGLRMLARIHGKRVRAALRFAFPLLDATLIDEAVEESLEEMWKQGNALRSDGSLAGYLLVTARRAVVRRLEKDERRRSREREAAHGRHPPTREVGGLDPKFKAALMRCISRLPESQQRVLLADLRHGHPVPADELAQELGGVSSNSIWVARSRGKQRVKRCLAEQGFAWGKEEGGDG